MKDNEIKITNRGAWLFVMLFVLLMGFVGYIETMPPAKSVTHEQCEEMSQVLSMMTASDAHDTLINKVREMGCDKNNYPIGVLVK
jgi:hypothetical protein